VGRRDRGPWGVAEEVATDERIRHEGFHHGSSYLEHLDFLDAVRNGAPASVSMEDGLMSVALGAAAQRSIAESRVVEMAELLSG